MNKILLIDNNKIQLKVKQEVMQNLELFGEDVIDFFKDYIEFKIEGYDEELIDIELIGDIAYDEISSYTDETHYIYTHQIMEEFRKMGYEEIDDIAMEYCVEYHNDFTEFANQILFFKRYNTYLNDLSVLLKECELIVKE